jgi:hypothetical protein
MAKVEKIAVQSPLHPGTSKNVDRQKYEAMRAAILTTLPDKPPGLTYMEMREQMAPRLSQAVFPDGEKAGWWAKCVQLDLEAKGLVLRDGSSPLRLRRT